MSDGRIALSEPHLVGNASRYLEECLETNYVSSVGPFVERFEREFASYVGAGFAVACASGTAALHLAFRVLGVEPGAEVLLPTLTFVASANPVTYEGGRTVFVDSEPRTWNLDPDLVIEEIERRARHGERLPAAVEVVHVLGHPADIERLVRVCGEHGIPVVEDAAEALGARYAGGALDGRQVGTIGTVGCFSFNGNKVLTTGGGGMLVTDDEALARRAKHLTQQARLPGLAYFHDEIGYNYRLTNLAAALGVAQLEQLPSFLEAKQRIAATYDAAFRDHPALALPPREPWARSSLWLYSVLITDGTADRRDRVNRTLQEEGIDARPVWTPLHRLPMYDQAPCLGSAGEALRIAATGLSLPSSVNLERADQERVIAALLAALDDARS